MPVRIQRSRAKGWRIPDGALYVGRPTIWGNPFVVGDRSGQFRETGEILTPPMTIDTVMEFYRNLIEGFLCPEMHPQGHDWMRRFKAKVRTGHPTDVARSYLRGHDLVCWCSLDAACHADVLLEVANARS